MIIVRLKISTLRLSEGLEFQGPNLRPIMKNENESITPKFFRMLVDYLQRKYERMSRIEAKSVLASTALLQESSRVKFLCASQVMTVGSHSRYGFLEKRKSRNRSNWFIAAEMDEPETCSDIY